jgi:hypothetical protein
MPQFGSYTDGAPGQTTDEIVVKRSGTGTVRLALDKLPVSEAAATAFVGTNAFNTFQENTDSALAGKESILTFINASRVGNTVTIDPGLLDVTGQPSDGKSWWIAPATTNFSVFGANMTTTSYVSSAITGNVGPGNPTNSWNERGRARMTSAAAINSHVRIASSPKIRFPENSTTLYGGFRYVGTWAPNDTNAAAVGFYGLTQNLPAAGTAPNAYTGTRFGFAYDPALTGGDFNLKLINGATIIQDLGAGFPGNGNETAAYQIDIWARTYPNYGVTWSVTNLVSGAVASGTTTNIPLGTFDPNVILVRDSQGTATAVQITTTGIWGGSFANFVVGDSTLQIPSPLTVTGNTTMTKTTYGDVEVLANSASPITLTVDPTGYVAGDALYGINLGAGTVAFAAGSGVTINQHADVTTTVAQYKGWNLRCVATNTWVRLS